PARLSPNLLSFSTRRSSDLPLIQELKSKVETALWPFVDLETCLVADLDHMEREPVIYNTITKQIWVDGKWIDHELNLLCDRIVEDRKSTRLNSNHVSNSSAV